MLYLIDCDIVYLCSHGSSSCCIVLIVTVFIFVLMVLPHVALDWLWHCLSVFLWFFLKLHLIDSNIICLFSFGSSSCCIGFFVKLFVFVLMVLPHVALDWLWYCFSVFLWFYLRLHWIDCRINYLCSHGSSSCCIGLIVTLLTCVLIVQPYVTLDRLWHCLSVLSWFFLMVHCIDCDSIYLCSYNSSSCCIWLIVTLLICFLMTLPHVVFDWLWYCLSVFSWFFLMLHCIDCDCVYLCSFGSSSCCIGLIVTFFICVPMVLPPVALDW